MGRWWWFLVGAILFAPVWVGVTLLISRRVWQSARRLARRTREHEHLMELGHLVGGLAHEIKNPLSTINLNLRLLTEDLRDHPDETHQRWLRRLKGVDNEVNRLKGILDDFLRYARRMELQCEPTDLRRLLDELVDFFAPQAESNRVVLRTSLPDEPIHCHVDGNLIKQAVLNLMINAVQAMPEGGELLLRLCRRGKDALIEVIDTGPGMTEQTREKIFELYFSTKPGGSGLGLPMSRRIAREHNGNLTCESEPGKGTRFCITLPAMDSE